MYASLFGCAITWRQEKESSRACSVNHDIPLQFVNKTECFLCCVLHSVRNKRVNLKKIVMNMSESYFTLISI